MMCKICGSMSGGIHGFSFDSRARAYQELNEYDPEKEDKFVSIFIESMKKALEARSNSEL